MKILIATDGRPPAVQAIEAATKLLATKAADVLLVSVLDPERHTGGNVDAENDLAAGLTLLKEHGIAARTELLRGEFADAIVRKAKEVHADVVVMGHRRSLRLVELLIGSTSADVARRLDCAVFIVPYAERRRD